MSATLHNKFKICFGQAYIAFAFGILFLIGTGLVPEWGRWYSENIAYREQTEAMLRGSLALHSTPTALRNDLAFHDGAVQQVWGLAVPCWRLPFEIIARICGQQGFPDRLAFGAALMLASFMVFRVFLPSKNDADVFLCISFGNPLRLAGVFVLLLFPPIVIMCRFRFDVYEEAVAYAYLFGICLYVGIVSFLQTATRTKLYLLCLLSGVAPASRPTLTAYSVSTLLLLWVYSKKPGMRKHCLAGCGLSALCVLGLLFSNYIRFGSIFEFGHQLNVNGFPIWFFDRFYNPFHHEPVLSAARELFGSLFCSPTLNAFDWNRANLFWGQSTTPRWRHFYLSCFDLSFFILLVISWTFGLWRLLQRLQESVQSALEFCAAELWSTIAIVLLTAFYLRAPVMSNRYALDFAPGIAVAIAGLLFNLECVQTRAVDSKHIIGWCIFGAVISWAGWEVCTATTTAGPSPAITQSEVLGLVDRGYANPELPKSHYAEGEDLSVLRIPYNGAGWSKSDGRMDRMVVLFIKDPEFLELHLASMHQSKHVNFADIQAKIGLEFLTRRSVVSRDSSCVIIFNGPKRPFYQKGIQILFLANVDKSELSLESSPVRLTEVIWKSQNQTR